MPEEVSKEALTAWEVADQAADRIDKMFSFETLTDPENLRCRLRMAAREAIHLWNSRSPSALTVGEEDALTAWVTKIALEGDIVAKDGLEFGDLVRAFRAGFRAAIAAMNGGGE